MASGITATSNSLAAVPELEGDVVLVGQLGQNINALSDFPHARENCGVYKFQSGQEIQRCVNCYCYVCDAIASSCMSWTRHCQATHTKQEWRKERLARANQKETPALYENQYDALLATTPAESSIVKPRVVPRTCDEFLKAIEQVTKTCHNLTQKCLNLTRKL